MQANDTLGINAQTVANDGGSICNAGTGTTTVSASGALSNTAGGLIGGNGDVSVSGGSIDNGGGSLVAGGALAAQSGGTLNNAAGLIQSDGDASVSAQGALTNAGGQIGTNGSSAALEIAGASLDNSSGRIANIGTGATTVSAGSITNSNGSGVAGAGVIGGNGDVMVSGASLSNTEGGEIVAGNNLTVNESQSVDNSGGTLSGANDLTLNGTFVASGNAQTAGLKLERIFHRSQNDVSGVEFQLIKRFGASFIEGTEIPQQQRNNTFIEAGLTNRHYFGAAQFDGTLAYRQGTGGFGAQSDTPGGPTYRFHMATLDANLSVPFRAAGQSLRYVGTVHGQFTNDELNYIDDLTIGSRYTVRCFSGQTMLAAEKGFYWRNELQYPLGASGQVLYAGLDYGHLWGPWAANLAGTQLAGAAFGVKGSVPSRLGAYSYDVFAGTPIYKPAGFDAARVVLGFQATAQF
ncbi:ShlB/FhaC/HecB family hemolysin secretion/activation protein [Paraburkholderia youngii]|uniref:Haemolysin activator HlyB C-terminal domain-containing protein n=1 Tax=Paraburkholderia youngii TaxID=2782701 RepID=A0ABX2NG16_9BURK|nr:ShlB/FhaC/HecB family hemolysin secretion/activation protein [Paraburkholderia youngii]NVI03299.1 hypothetical protein [Paraburkholderia youngii]